MDSPKHILRNVETQVAAIRSARRQLMPAVAEIANTEGATEQALAFCASILASDAACVDLLQTLGQCLPFEHKRRAMQFETFDSDGQVVE